MTNLFSKGFTLLLYHLGEILPDSADSNRRLWSGLMYYPVFPVIQMPPLLVLGKNTAVWNAPLGFLAKPFFIPRHMLRHLKYLIWENLCANTCQWKVIVQMQIRSPLVGRTVYQCGLILQAPICLSWLWFKMRWESCSWCFEHCW